MATENEKPKVTTEKIVISPKVEWDLAITGLAQLKQLLDDEIDNLRTRPDIKNAYSPLTWHKLCYQVQHVTEGMTAVRLSLDGRTSQQVEDATGIHRGRVAAFRAWNTRWVKAVQHYREPLGQGRGAD